MDAFRGRTAILSLTDLREDRFLISKSAGFEPHQLRDVTVERERMAETLDDEPTQRQLTFCCHVISRRPKWASWR
jgi:hypothetical protein